MPDRHAVAQHYASEDLLARIRAGLAKLGITSDDLKLEDLAPVDEFHIGGREASLAFFEGFDFRENETILDVGCGLGGAARLVSSRFGCRVEGIDLTPEFVKAGNELCRWADCGDRVRLQEASALALPFGDAIFDAGYMMHVGMNIADKPALFTEIARVIRPDAYFGVYDVMQANEGELLFPVPWASVPDNSALASAEHYRQALSQAGFELVTENNRRDFARAFFQRLARRQVKADGPPPLGLHMLMGERATEKIRNMIDNLAQGLIEPVEMIARRRR